MESVESADRALGSRRVQSFDEFISVVQRGKVGPGTAFTDVVTKQQAHLMQDRKGHIVHSFAKEECLAFVNHINRKLGDDPECAYLLPLSVDDVGALFSSVVDGVLLCAAYVASATCVAYVMRYMRRIRRTRYARYAHYARYTPPQVQADQHRGA